VPAKKKRNIISQERIVVNSEAYGKHLRSPRGSKTRAVLNPAMKAHGRRLRKSNIPAKLIMDALQPFRENFKGGMLWQRLVKHFAAQAKNGDAYSVKGIGMWDLNNRYLTSRIMTDNVEVKPNKDFSMLEIDATYALSKRFLERKSNITAFRITLIFMFPDFKNNKMITNHIAMPDKLLSDHSVYSFIEKIPRVANSYLVCFKAEDCVDGVVQNANNINKAMRLIASGMR
jgi:hypothetical protein